MKFSKYPILLVGLLISSFIAGSIYYQGVKNQKVSIPTRNQAVNISINQHPEDTSNWNTYTNPSSNVSLRHPSFYSPVEKFIPLKSGEPIFIVSNKSSFDRNTLGICETYKEKMCLIPGKNWGQRSNIQPTTIANKPAVSFFVAASNRDSGSNVLHVIQTTENPPIEIAMTVDGVGGEETFQKILSTFQFIQ